MPIGLSLYLDVVRFAAALAVFLFHMGYGKLAGAPFGIFVQFGEPAVLVFFVLSGFVISHVRATREQGLASFAIARLSRVYSVALPALLLTIPLDLWGAALNPDLYPTKLTLTAFLRCLTFTNMVGDVGYVFGTAVVYWSLCYEVWYYLLFAIAMFARGYMRILLLALGAAYVGRSVLEVFPVWLFGVACYSTCARAWVGRAAGWFLFVAPIVIYGIMVQFDAVQPIAHGLGGSRQQLVLIYGIGLLFAAQLVGAHAVSDALERALRRIAGLIRWLAGTTFTLYLLHVPVAFLIRSLVPWEVQSWKSMASILIGTMAVVFLVAEFTERRKDIWRRGFAVPVNALARLAAPGVVAKGVAS